MRKKNKKGFTLIEIMAVVVILGLLTAVAVPRFTSKSRYELENTVRNLSRDIKFAQQEAMKINYEHKKTEKAGVRMKFYPKTGPADRASYHLLYVTSAGTEIPLDTEPYSKKIDLPSGIDFSGNITEPLNLVSDSVYLTFKYNGEIGELYTLNDSWGNNVSGYVYLNDENTGKKASVEIAKPWANITVRNFRE